MTRTPHPWLARALLATAMLVASCGDAGEPETASDPGPPVETEGEAETETGSARDSSSASVELTELPPFAQAVIGDVQAALAEPPEVWAGFDPENHPLVVVLADGDEEVIAAVTLHHPAADELGEAVAVEGVDGLESLRYVESLVGVGIPENQLFDLEAEVGGVRSLVMVSREAEGKPPPIPLDIRGLLPAGTPEWQFVLMHEMFHQHQVQFWVDDSSGLEDYDFDVENFELALLEDAALVEAYDTTGPDSEAALRRWAALRSNRLERYPGVALDEYQESIEGIAEWFAWRSTERANPPYAEFAYGSLAEPEGFTAEYKGGPAPFERFYLSGATIMELLDRQGVDWHGAIEGGASPSELLRAVVEIDEGDVDSLIAEARATYDPDGTLVALAEEWVAAEPVDGLENQTVEIPEELAACLADFDVEPEDLVDGFEPSAEMVEACF